MTEQGDDNSWKQRVTGVLNTSYNKLIQLLPVEQVTQTVGQWFSVSEAQVAEILETIRAELPTTEALLLENPKREKVQLSED